MLLLAVMMTTPVMNSWLIHRASLLLAPILETLEMAGMVWLDVSWECVWETEPKYLAVKEKKRMFWAAKRRMLPLYLLSQRAHFTRVTITDDNETINITR